MPLLTTVIDDKSPLISYDATWLFGTAWGDQWATDYYLGTFTTNNVTDGSATLNFNGTAIWIYGANRPNHGSYTVQVDGATYSGYNGAGNNLFQQSLFNASFNQAMHTVKLTNTASGNLYVDIDMIVWQSEVGSTGDHLAVEVVQDTDARFRYQEPAWGTTSSSLNFNLFGNGTGHVTETYDASVTFTFTAVTIFGTSGPSNGPYSALLDGGQSVQYNASNAYPTNYGVAIYHADNLGSGSHQLVLTNLPDSASGQSLSVDYAQLWTIAKYSAINSVIYSPNLTSGAIAGIVVAVVAAVLSAGAAIFFYRRWKATLATQHDLYRIYTPQGRPLESATVAPTGFSSSLETRTNASLLQNDSSTQPFSGRAQQPANHHAAQHDETVHISRDSRSTTDTVSSPFQSPVEESSGQRPLPEAPGGGLSLSDEFPKFANLRRGQSMMTADRSSIAMSEVPPPNYTQAIGNAATAHHG
ncbi:hypothetical protein J3R83DRAFT_4369 [Lanmaoa asiatica]|nr:hypothetical protein J3R83DRAFT_4369 [Lanmaoa asiatica]